MKSVEEILAEIDRCISFTHVGDHHAHPYTRKTLERLKQFILQPSAECVCSETNARNCPVHQHE